MSFLFDLGNAVKRELGKTYQPGEFIFRQGDVANSLFVVQKGEVEILLETTEREQILDLMGEGDIFGEIALFAEKARFTSARAKNEARVLRVDEKTFISKLHQDPSVAFRLIKRMAQRLYELDHQMMRRACDEQCPDALTGLPTFPNATEMLTHEVKRSRKLRQTLAYAVIDIDDHKTLLETYGEEVWHFVLRQLSDILRQQLRKTDAVGRYGNDRFPIILFEANGPAAVRVIENVRKKFADTKHVFHGNEVSTTFSCGIAIFPEHADANALRDAANKALRQAKNRGRNQVVLADPATPPCA
ncbi:MAG: GGDEF domain-containing protein [Magnetococcales bacterium]|nr:GGDEF domain-containing protein [Magnetococcales bacterium]NGZ26681.1 GGDEF domain-containing protein [Magnetococcales bacterium]